MDENAIEKSGGKSLLGFLKPKKDIVKRISREEFEGRLFSGGTYHFDFDRDVRELEMDVGRAKAWYDGNPGWDEKRTADSMKRDINDARYNLTWRSQFSDQIPRRWLDWCDIGDDFEEAERLNLQLSDGLVDAGITHPHHLVANTVGKAQKLNEAQLGAAVARSDIPAWNEEEISKAQLKRGLSKINIRKAQARAEEIKRSMRNKKQLREPWPELTKGDK